MDYESLRIFAERATIVCDPITFSYRQKSLLNALTVYILERDNPHSTDLDLEQPHDG